MPHAVARRQQESVPAQVMARMASAVMGSVMQTMSASLFGDTFKSAPLRNPPIATGMTETVEKLKAILTKKSAISQNEYQQVPALLRRVRYLLRVYYDAKISGRKPVEFKYCDLQDVSHVGLDLHECGLTLQLMPGRLRALWRYAPDVDAFFFEEPLDLGKWRIESFAQSEAVAADTESTDDDRMAAGELEEKAGSDLAASQMSFMMGDILVAWILVSPVDDVEERRAKRAMERLVEYACSPPYRKGQALGDALSEAMRVVYTTPDVLLRFAHAGGLPALFDDWASAAAKDGYIKDAVETLPVQAWENQTPDSLLGVMQGIVNKLSVDGEQIVRTSLFAKIIHRIYSRYGIEPFERASTISDSCILFYFLYRRISRKPDAYKSYENIRALLKRYTHVPETTRRKHGWMILSVGGRWDCIDLYGCAYHNCPEQQELLELKQARKRGVRDPVVEEQLYKWGGESKACTQCRAASYCSTACQKADWPTHKVGCQKNDGMEVEI